MSKVTPHFQNKNKTLIYSFRCPNKESGKIFKKEVAEPYLEPCKISMMGHFCDSIHTLEVVRDSEINLKRMNSKMLEKLCISSM